MEAKADKIRWSVDKDGTWLHIRVEDGKAARYYAEQNADKPQRMRLTTWREKRSLSANAYAWELLGKLSAVLRIPPEEIYWRLVPDVGDNMIFLSVAVPALQELKEKWSSHGIGWQTKIIGASDRPGMVDIALYYGSSAFDTAQMSRLIDLIIAECRDQGIEYLPPDKINAMLEAWNEREDKGAVHQQQD